MLLHSFLLPLMKTTLLVLKLTLRLNNNNSQAKNKDNSVVVMDVVMVTDTATVIHMLVALVVSDSSLELLMRAKEDATEVEEAKNGNSLLVT